MTLNEKKEHINSILNRAINKSESSKLPSSQNASFNIYNKTWCSTISIDIVELKEHLKYYERWKLVKIMQTFSSTIIKIGKKRNNYISCYVNGDQVILNFNSDTKDKVSQVYGCAVEINSSINYLLKNILSKKEYDKKLKAGIGIWLSINNSLVKYGEKGSSEESFNKIVGDSINFSTQLSKISNRNS